MAFDRTEIVKLARILNANPDRLWTYFYSSAAGEGFPPSEEVLVAARELMTRWDTYDDDFVGIVDKEANYGVVINAQDNRDDIVEQLTSILESPNQCLPINYNSSHPSWSTTLRG